MHSSLCWFFMHAVQKQSNSIGVGVIVWILFIRLSNRPNIQIKTLGNCGYDFSWIDSWLCWHCSHLIFCKFSLVKHESYGNWHRIIFINLLFALAIQNYLLEWNSCRIPFVRTTGCKSTSRHRCDPMLFRSKRILSLSTPCQWNFSQSSQNLALMPDQRYWMWKETKLCED